MPNPVEDLLEVYEDMVEHQQDLNRVWSSRKPVNGFFFFLISLINPHDTYKAE